MLVIVSGVTRIREALQGFLLSVLLPSLHIQVRLKLISHFNLPLRELLSFQRELSAYGRFCETAVARLGKELWILL